MEPRTYITDTISLSLEERFEHVAIFGASGTGKSITMLRLLLADIIDNGHGITLIDPHGSLAAAFLERLPKYLDNRIAILDFEDRDMAVGIDFLSCDPHMVVPTADSVTEALHSVWAHSWGPELSRNRSHSSKR